jgi:predicted DNA binding CopG/RHH family protein
MNEDVRNKRFEFRLSEQEATMLRRLASASGLKESQVVRDLIRKAASGPKAAVKRKGVRT